MTPRPRQRPPVAPVAPRSRHGSGAVSLALAGGILLVHWLHALRVPFINDDYVFLDMVRDRAFASLWGTSRLMFGWWRPVSREFHYWALERTIGARELPFHVASLLLALAVLAVYYRLARRLAGARAAAIASAGVAVMAAWAVPMVWVAGAQELWMLLFALLCIDAFAFGSVWIAAPALAVALLSKETAAVVPGIALAVAIATRRFAPRATLLRVLPLAAVTVAWALVHPAVRAMLTGVAHGAGSADGTTVTSPAAIVLHTLRVPVNLDQPPAPDHGWMSVLVRAAPSIVLVVLAVVWAFRNERREGGGSPAAGAGTGVPALALVPRSRAADIVSPASTDPRPLDSTHLAACTIVWALLGWLPVLWPALGWHSYYTLLGAFGVWLLAGAWLARERSVALTVLIALAVLRAGQAATPSLDWGTEWYQNRAAAFVQFLRADLLQREPRPAPHSRLFFGGVPSNVGFLTAGAPALRVWYGDSTLSGGYMSQYAARGAGAAPGPDRFFRYDSTAGWVELRTLDEPAAARAENPRWEADHRELAAVFARARDWTAAAHEYARLATAADAPLKSATDAGVCFAMAGDSTAAARWFALAARQPGADDEVKAFARRFAHHLSAVP